MLVCFLVARPLAHEIAADLAEAAAADDASLWSMSFDLVVDEPASADDLFDAFFGDPIAEAASANDVVDAKFGQVAALVETANAQDQIGIDPGDREVIEAANAEDMLSASTAGIVTSVLSTSSSWGKSAVVEVGGGKTQIISDIGVVS